MSNTKHVSAIPSPQYPALAAAEYLSSPVEVVESPTAPPTAVPDESMAYVEFIAKAGPLANVSQETAEQIKEVHRLRGEEDPAGFASAMARTRRATRLIDIELEKVSTLKERFPTRDDRTRSMKVKINAAYLGFLCGELTLNTMAATAQGDDPLKAALSFFGVAAGTLIVGYAVGRQIRDAVDRAAAGPVPEDLAGKGFDDLYADSGKRWWSPVPDLVFWVALLVAYAAATGLLIATLRQESDGTPLWGLMSAVMALASAAPGYLMRNKVSDLIEASEDEISEQQKLIDADAKVIREHNRAQQASRGAQMALPHRVAAIGLANYTTTYGMLSSQGHIVGTNAARSAMPAELPQLEVQLPVAKVPSPDEVWESDWEIVQRGRGSRDADAGGGEVTVAQPADDHDSAWLADLMSDAAGTFGPTDAPTNGGGHP